MYDWVCTAIDNAVFISTWVFKFLPILFLLVCVLRSGLSKNNFRKQLDGQGNAENLHTRPPCQQVIFVNAWPSSTKIYKISHVAGKIIISLKSVTQN